MYWILFSFITAISESLKDVFSKKSLRKIDEYIVAWSLRFFSLPFLLPLLFFIDVPSLNQSFYLMLLLSGSLNILATILYMKAIKESDLSSTVPFVAFTPLFLLVISPFVLNEFPGVFGFIGVLLIIFGSYILNIKQSSDGLLKPFKSILKERGPRLMLFVALIWSISSSFDKIGVQNSSPIFWAIAMNSFISIVMFPLVVYKSSKIFLQLKNNFKKLLPIGIFSSLTLVSQMTAINMTLVTNVISIKRTSSIFSVLFGYLIFREKNIKNRLLGAIIMIAGVVFITLFD